MRNRNLDKEKKYYVDFHTQIASLQRICKKLGLKQSSGSDNHLNPGERFGKYPVYIYEELMSLERE